MWHYHALSGIRNESYLRNDPAEGTGWPWRIIVIMRRYDVGKRTWNLHSYRIGRKSPVLHRPQKKIWKADFPDKSTTGTTSTSVFLRTTFRNSAITPASPLIKKSTTLRSSLWCSLLMQCGKATAVFVSSRDRDFVPEVGQCGSRLLDLFFSYCGQVFFLLLLHRWAVLVSYAISYLRCNVFFYLYSGTIHRIFLSTFLRFLRHVSSRLRRRRHYSKRPPPWNTSLVCIHEHTVNIFGYYSIKVYRASTFAAKIA